MSPCSGFNSDAGLIMEGSHQSGDMEAAAPGKKPASWRTGGLWI
jgi:hypothetical protein